jgi:hypothetical protein
MSLNKPRTKYINITLKSKYAFPAETELHDDGLLRDA